MSMSAGRARFRESNDTLPDGMGSGMHRIGSAMRDAALHADASASAVLVIGRDGVIVDASVAVEPLVGVGRAWLRGRDAGKVLAEANLEVYRAVRTSDRMCLCFVERRGGDR